MRVSAVAWCAQIPGLQCYLFRRISDDLVKNHIEGPKGLRAMLAPWTLAGLVQILEDEIRFWNGSKIYLCHCKDEKDRFKYLGAEIHVLFIDELTTFTETIYRFLRSRVRAVGLNPPPEMAGLFPRIVASSNPGNIGHHWVKAAFIDAAPPLEIWRAPDEEGGMLRQYIPAKLDDNPSMASDDPQYRMRLRGLGSPDLVRAMEDGDWNVIAGAFFPEFCDRHVVAPFKVPSHWVRYRSMDWGSAKPFAVHWWAVSDGELTEYPRGALICYREWYGMQPGRPNVGVKMTAEQVADGILEREEGEEKIDFSVLDPAAFAQDGGPSLAERMAKRGVYFQRADNSRVGARGAMGGWDLVRQRLLGEDDRPMLYFFSTCRDIIRTLPSVQHDERRVEDLDTFSEDHACLTGDTLVQTAHGPVPIADLTGTTGLVESLGGLREYTAAARTRRDAKLVRVEFDDGSSVRCTPDHRFLTTKGWEKAEDCLDAMCYARGIWSSPSPTLSKSSSASVTTAAGSTFSARASACIASFGNITAARFLSAITSITRTRIAPTIKSAILSCFPAQTICANTLTTSPALPMPFAWRLRSGTEASRAGAGTDYTTCATARASSTFGPVEFVIPAERTLRGSASRGSAQTPARRNGEGTRASITSSVFARFVARRSWSASTASNPVAVDPAGSNLRLMRIVSVAPAGRADVYCLSVPGTHAFALANGVITHNCDSLRYACAARPWVREAPQTKPVKFANSTQMTVSEIIAQRRRQRLGAD